MRSLPSCFCRGRPAAALAAVLALSYAPALPAQEKPKETDILYPRGAASAAGPVETKTGDSLGRPLLFLALLAGGAGAWLLWRQRRGLAAGAHDANRRLAIAESRPLGNRQYLVVADYDGKKFLLGVCPGRIDLLAPLEGGDTRKP